MELEAALVQHGCRSLVAEHEREDAGTGVDIGPECGDFAFGHVEEVLEPRAPFGEVPVDLPEAPKPGRELQALALLAGLVEAPLQHRPQVVVLAVEPPERGA